MPVTPRVLAGALVYLPAAWVLAGLAAALYGLLPRFEIASWAALVGFLLLEFGWELQQMRVSALISPIAESLW